MILISLGAKKEPILSRQSSFIAIAVSIVGILTYTIYVTFWCKTKSQCNDIHPYISAFPIIGFIVLRNIPGNVLECAASFMYVKPRHHLAFAHQNTIFLARLVSYEVLVVLCLVRENLFGAFHIPIPHLVGGGHSRRARPATRLSSA